MYTIQVAKK